MNMSIKLRDYIDERWGIAEQVLRSLLKLTTGIHLNGLNEARRLWEANKLIPFMRACPIIFNSDVPLTYSKVMEVNLDNPSPIEMELLKSNIQQALNDTVNATATGTDAIAKLVARAYEKTKTKIEPSNLQDYTHNLCRFVQGRIEAVPANDVVNNRLSAPVTMRSTLTHAKGVKFTKAMGAEFEYFYRTRDESVRPAFVDAANQVLSIFMSSIRCAKDKKVVISIDPVDMLCASDLTTSWTSCYQAVGAHATAPLSLLCDKSSAIAYSYTDTVGEKSASGVLLPTVGNFINKKVWRQLLHFDFESGAAVLDKEYPHPIPLLAHCTLGAVEDLLMINALRKFPKPVSYILEDIGDNHRMAKVMGTKSIMLSPCRSDLRHKSGWVYTDPMRNVVIVTDPMYVSEREVVMDSSYTKCLFFDRSINVYDGAEVIPCIVCGKPRIDTSARNKLFSPACCGERPKANKKIEYNYPPHIKYTEEKKSSASCCSKCGKELPSVIVDPTDKMCDACFFEDYAVCKECNTAWDKEDIVRGSCPDCRGVSACAV